MNMKKMVAFSFVLAAFAGFGAATGAGTSYVMDALAPYVEKGELPGAISILYNDGVQEVACAGYADVAAKRPISLDDPFMQCSQTKGFCGVTVAKLVEEGRLDLDDPVSKYLPEFATLWVEEKSGVDGERKLVRAKNVLTVRMVLNHTGGFPFEICCKQGAIPGGGWSGGAPLRSTAAIAASASPSNARITATRSARAGAKPTFFRNACVFSFILISSTMAHGRYCS